MMHHRKNAVVDKLAVFLKVLQEVPVLLDHDRRRELFYKVQHAKAPSILPTPRRLLEEEEEDVVRGDEVLEILLGLDTRSELTDQQEEEETELLNIQHVT